MTDFVFRNIDNSAGSATISDRGAHLLRWRPLSQATDVVFAPSSVVVAEGRPLGGGVPVIFPWFGPGFADGHGLGKKPNHGFVRTRQWHLDANSFINSYAHYSLTEADVPSDMLPWFEGDAVPSFRADYEVHVADTLTMTLTVTNTGATPFSYEAALHTYFHVSDVSQIRLTGLEHAHYEDATNGFAPCEQPDEAVTFDGPVDRVYASTAAVELHDEGFGRTIHVAKSGSAQTVVWNPAEPYGVLVNDSVNEEWRHFVCCEAAACREHAVRLEPGESHALTQTLSAA